MKSNDLVLVLSGGSENQNPILSVGGSPSVYPINHQLNNLFDDSEDQYRCIYFFNNHTTDTLYNVNIYVEKNPNIELGFKLQTEIQTVKPTKIIKYKDFKEDRLIDFDNLEIGLNEIIPGTKVVNNKVHFPDFKCHDLLTNATKIQTGSPINTIATFVNNDQTPPDIKFKNYTKTSPLLLTRLEPGDGLPIWIKRMFRPTNTATDGFSLKITGKN